MAVGRRGAVAGGAVAALVLAAGVVALVARGSSSDRATPVQAGAEASTTTSAPPATTTAASPVTTTTLPAGKVVSAEGALLVTPARPIPQSTQPATAECRSLGTQGWAVVDCGIVEMAGGRRVWLVESRPATAAKRLGDTERRALVMHHAGTTGWVIDLSFRDELAEGTAMIFKAADLTGDGRPELVFGFRNQGTGAILRYDIVVAEANLRVGVAAAREVYKGVASLAGGVVTDYEAKYPNNEPNCCPAYLQKSVVRYAGGSEFRVVDAERVAPNAPIGPVDI